LQNQIAKAIPVRYPKCIARHSGLIDWSNDNDNDNGTRHDHEQQRDNATASTREYQFTDRILLD
jgi:hypothetical protein